MFLDIGHMHNDDADILILEALRDELNALDDWSLSDEGTWEEHAREGGAYCVRTWGPIDNEEDYLDAAEATREYITELEARVWEHGYVAYPDGENGVYRIERVEDAEQ